MNLTEADLLAHLLGALDPGDAAWVAARAGAEDHLRAASLAAWGNLAAGAPPPLRGHLAAAEVLSADEGLHVGDRVTVGLEWAGPLDRARCAVFRTVAGRSERLWPAPGAWAPLSRFRQRDGAPVADLVLAGPPGPQTFEFVLVHADVADEGWPDGDARWQRLLDAFRGGRLSGCAVEVEVA